jgi:hypothetical protein
MPWGVVNCFISVILALAVIMVTHRSFLYILTWLGKAITGYKNILIKPLKILPPEKTFPGFFKILLHQDGLPLLPGPNN